MSELIQDVDPGKLPPRTRVIYSHVGAAIAQGWKPIELAEKLGCAPSVISSWLHELRTALGYLNGVFPAPSDDDYHALVESIATHGVLQPIIVDDAGIIDGHQRGRALADLHRICDIAEQLPEWERVVEIDHGNHTEAIEIYGRTTVEDARWLASFGQEIVGLAQRHRWEDFKVERRTGLNYRERRELAITLNANRRHLERGDYRLLVECELSIEPLRTNREIAGIVGCSPQYIGQVRQALADDEKLFGDTNNGDDSQKTKVVSLPWKPVSRVELDCPHCRHHLDLALERAGREFRALPAADQAA